MLSYFTKSLKNIWDLCMYVWVCAGECSIQESQKRALDPSGAGVKALGSCLLWVLGTEVGSSEKVVNILNFRVIPPAPCYLFSIYLYLPFLYTHIYNDV